MAKLIIWIGGKPIINGYRIRDFHWNVAHACYIYEGVEIEDAKFNEKFEKAYRNHADLHPKVKVVATSKPEVQKPAPPPIATISAAKEITLEDAVAVVAQLAPERLKKMPGRPRMMEVA